MAITDKDKIDFLWKKVIYGVTKTASGDSKFGANERIPSPFSIDPQNIWGDSDEITAVPPAATNDVIFVHSGVTAIQMTMDPSAPPNQSWIAATEFGDDTTNFGDFIPPTFGSGYLAKVYIGNPSLGNRIFPDAPNQEFVFDYAAGVVNFINQIPSGVSSAGVFVEVYRYIGARGIGSSTDGELFVIKTGDVMSGALLFGEDAANAVSGIDGTGTDMRIYGSEDGKVSLGNIVNGSYEEKISINPQGLMVHGEGDGNLAVPEGSILNLGQINNTGDFTAYLSIDENGVLWAGDNRIHHDGYPTAVDGLVAGSYTNANVTVDNRGRVIAIANGQAGGGGGTPSSITFTGDVTGTGTGNIALSLANIAGVAGSYTLPSITVDSKGRITAVSNGTAPSAVTYVDIDGSSDIVVGGEAVTSTGTFTLALSNSGASAGTYTNPVLTVDSKGRITAISNGSGGGGGNGADGKSAYQLAVDNGFSGTVAQWLESLKGERGADATLAVRKDNAVVASSTGILNFTGNVGVSHNGGVTTVNVPTSGGGGSVTLPALNPYVEYIKFRWSAGNGGTLNLGSWAEHVVETTDGIASVEITDAANCWIKITFTGRPNPPAGITLYGQAHATNEFVMNSISQLHNRRVSGGGTSSNPAIIGGFNDMTIQVKMADLNASVSTIGVRATGVIMFVF